MLVCENELLIVVLWLVGFEWICVRVGAGRVIRVKFLLSLQVRNMAFREVDRELRCNQLLCLDEGAAAAVYLRESKNIILHAERVLSSSCHS